MAHAPSADEIRAMLVVRVAEALGIALEQVDTEERFSALGLDSAAVTSIMSAVSTSLGLPVPLTMAWRMPSIDSLARHLADPPEEAAERVSATRGDMSEPIAVVGMSCRFPGASGLEEYWRLLSEGTDAVDVMSPRRWGHRSNRPSGGYLDDVSGFDPQFFGISPREAVEMDPQQRLMLELAWTAVEDSGRAPETLRDSRTAVFTGALWSDYARLNGRRLDTIGRYTATGQDLGVIAARVSYALGLRGPSVGVTTACSSSLVAVYLAAQSLRAGDATLAIAGGVNLILAPESTVAMTEFGALSPTGRCHSFGEAADGYVRGEGGGVVVLQRLTDALATGARIYCLLRGGSINNDGYSNGLSAPSPVAQEDMLRDAYARTGLRAVDVDYVEAHGTGTEIGDPIEAGALGAVLGADRPEERPLLIGSVKSNIGHLESAAGIAGLIKVALALRNRTIPPSLHAAEPSSRIPFERLRLRVVDRSLPWPAPLGTAVAGVSSFGFGGTNCHLVLTELSADHLRRTQSTDIAVMPDQRSSVPVDAARVAFVFSGQGAQWVGMGRGLLVSEPVFAAALRRCDTELRALTGWSVIDELLVDERDSRLHRTDVVQPMLFAIQVALARLWQSLGVEPDVVLGHSVGEVAAAHVSGMLSLRDAAGIVYHRSRMMASIDGRGAVAVVDLDAARARDAVSGYGGQVTVAGRNSPTSTMVAGEPRAVDEVVARLHERGIGARRVAMGVASHTSHCDPLLPDLLSSLSETMSMPALTPMISTVTATTLIECPAQYWVRNLRESVNFVGAVERVLADGPAIFLEVAPHPVLSRSIEQIAGARGLEVPVLASSHRDETSGAVLERSLRSLRAAGRHPAGRSGADIRILPLSAHSDAALRELARTTATLVAGRTDGDLDELCSTSAKVRGAHRYRLAVPFRTRAELVERLRSESTIVERARRNPQVAFAFSGQGTQWHGMAAALLASEPIFREALYRVDLEVRGRVGWSVLDELARDSDSSLTDRTDIAQPTLFAIQVGLVELLRAWGVRPSAVVGHSMGEIAAAYVAGILDLPDAVRIACRRGALMAAADSGVMVAVRMAHRRVREVIAGRAGVSVAAVNSPSVTVVAGAREDLEPVLADLTELGVLHRFLPVDYAFHSEMMRPFRDDLAADLRGIRPYDGTIPMVSTMTGGVLAGAGMDSDYWARTVTDTVLFESAVLELAESGISAVVELGPHPVLGGHLRECLGDRVEVFGSMRRDAGVSSLLSTVAELYRVGFDIDWSAIHPPAHLVALPPYPWQREPYWVSGEQGTVDAFTAPSGPSGSAISADTDPRYRLEWREAAASPAAAPVAPDEHWLIVGHDEFGVADALRRAGRTCRVTTPSSLHDELVGRASAARIVFVPMVSRTGREPDEGWREAVEPVLAVIRAATEVARSRIWILTTIGQKVVDDDLPDPCHAAVTGLGRALALEHPECWGATIDGDGKQVSTAAVVAALLSADDEDRVAIRDGRRYVARLTRAPRAQAPRPRLPTDATYLITGGLGGVGSQVARRLVARGARNLVLVGRRAAEETTANALGEYASAGVRCVVSRTDVTNASQVEALLAEIDAELPPLRGIVHAAGVLDDGVLLRQNWSRMQRVLAPKVVGAAHLHRLTVGRGLDFFVSMSSYTATLGAPGQAAYAAANAGLEALAWRAAAEGRSATAIGWGPWDGIGMAADRDLARVWSERGIRPFAPDAALELFEDCLDGRAHVYTAVDIDWSAYLGWLGGDRVKSDLSVFGAPRESDRLPSAGLVSGYEAAAPVDRERYVRDHVSEVLAELLGLRHGHAVDPETPLFDLGVDSMMAVTLANRLRSELADPTALPVTLALDYPTVAAIGAALCEVLRPDADRSLTDLLDEVEQMSDDEVARFLEVSQGSVAEGDTAAW